MRSDRFGVRYSKYDTHVNCKNVEVSVPVL